MAAPAPTVRQTPAGIKLKDGFRCLITFAADPDISLWEKTVTTGGIDGGDSIDQTTQWNVRWRTKAPRQLLEMTDGSFTCAYDPAVFDQIKALINVETTITWRWADGTTRAEFGYLKSFEENEQSEGEQPEAEGTIVITNWDPVNDVEADPVVTSVAGT